MKGFSAHALRKILLVLLALVSLLLFVNEKSATSNVNITGTPNTHSSNETPEPPPREFIEVSDRIKRGETLFDIFKRHELDIAELYEISKAAAKTYNLGKVISGHRYSIAFNKENRVQHMSYYIDDLNVLEVSRVEDGFSVDKQPVAYERKIAAMGGVIKDNLVSALPDLQVALGLSDVFAWDIDFTTDLRQGDTFKLLVEELWLDNEFKGYGSIISARFVNNGRTYEAYRFEQGGDLDYYDGNGKSLRRAFLKAPLSYRRISSKFTRKRYHPVLRRYSPHLGVDYSAPRGTPVSSVGDGTVVFAGYKGPNGRLVIIRHPGGYKTYYGHLSRIKKGIRKGRKIVQGQIIGYVGSTGRATGPHLDYRIKHRGKFINPLTLKLPRGKPITSSLQADFTRFRDQMNSKLSSVDPNAGNV
jgi:murein DD-endopeptidase MepM/ murein hydrolase activator NlpD